MTIHARNALVVDELWKQLAAGTRRAAIYYGAVHMPDFERRLLERGFRKTGTEWLTCWDVGRLRAAR